MYVFGTLGQTFAAVDADNRFFHGGIANSVISFKVHGYSVEKVIGIGVFIGIATVIGAWLDAEELLTVVTSDNADIDT